MKFALVPMFLLIVLAGCCTTKKCAEIDYATIIFENYDIAEIDTLLVTGYDPGTDFSTITISQFVDSTTYRNISSSSDEELAYYNLDVNSDWDLYIPATGQHFHVRYFDMQKNNCNNCPFDKTMTLSGFNVNDIHVGGTEYRVNKP